MSALDSDLEERLYAFKDWFQDNGGYIHPFASLISDGENTCLCASVRIGTNETIVTCPFSLVITTEATEKALASFCGLTSEAQAQFSARQRACIYISLHWTELREDSKENVLRHGPYFDILPPREQLMTPLFFSQDELSIFQGTNLYQATLKLRDDLTHEFESIHDSISSQAPKAAQSLTLEKYMLAAAYMNSRAFPSTLLSPKPSLLEKPGSYAVLIPGLDSMNHAPGHPVTWAVAKRESKGLSIGLVSEVETFAGDEIVNNYGPKPNASLILGYGFAMPHNLNDSIFLKIGFKASAPPQSSAARSGLGNSELGTEIGRSAAGVDELWSIIRVRCVDDECGDSEAASLEDDESAAVKDFTRDRAALDLLHEMVEALQVRLEAVKRRKLQGLDPVRVAKIKKMHRHYLSGQLDITRDLQLWLRNKEEELRQRQEDLGVVFEEEDSDGPEETDFDGSEVEDIDGSEEEDSDASEEEDSDGSEI